MDIFIGLIIVGYFLGWIVFPIWWALIPEPKGMASRLPESERFRLYTREEIES